MSALHLTDELCLDYLTGELPVDKRQSFEGHLDECSRCRQTVEEYRTILRSGASVLASEVLEDPPLGSVPWSIEEGQKRLYAAIATKAGARGPFEQLKTQLPARKGSKARLANVLLPSNLLAQLTATILLIHALTLGIFI